MKQAFCSLCAMVVLTLASGGFSSSWAQTPSATPEPFLIQLTSSPVGFRTTANDITANGRLVVFESNGNLATDRSEARNNSDGNREIFIADYAQRRIFQITNTKNVPKPSASPTPTPSPAPSPTPTPSPTPADPTQIQIEISNNRPMISLEPALSASNQRVYTIVFSSNAPDPSNFSGVDTGGALAADGNQEIWVYQVPAIADVDLTSGANLPMVTLSGGVFTRITDTPATLLPTPGATGVAPQVADDNRDATISDDGNRIVFVSTGNLVPSVGNADRNPELFFFNRQTSAFAQATITQSTGGVRPFSVFQQNPSLSSDGSVVAFLSTANLAGNNDDGNGRGNLEIYVANYNGAAISNVRQATRTRDETRLVNSLHPGRRLSRDGSLIALESLAADPKANSSTNEGAHAIFVYSIAADTFVRVGQRAVAGADVIRFPTFTDYNTLLQPATLIFASALNFKPDGTFPPPDQANTGLNPNTVTQIFATQAAATPSNTFTRLSRHPALVANDIFVGVRPLVGNSLQRIAYSHGGAELGTGNPDKSVEAFYLLSLPVTSELSAPLSFFTGASEFPLPTPASPSPSPTPSPSPGTITGLAPGELGIVRTTVEFAPSDLTASGGSETLRSPALPVELNGVSVSVNGAAAGLYFVGRTSNQINFVVPLGAFPGVATVVINSRLNGGTQLRGLLQIVPAQPDLFSAAGRAAIVNVTNPAARTGEPFTVTSVDGSGMTVPTVLEITLTGVRGVTPAEVKVTVGTTDITGSSIVLVRPNPEMPGFDIINFTLPASLANSPNVPVIVTVTRGASVFSSRPAATAPLITISP
ncbi:MAG: PD40 domain-containing protein [Pyrinomonadaceae bacterium]|nr:PD40 domain-containing protein [Pyrinomonadaceae bacterium]